MGASIAHVYLIESSGTFRKTQSTRARRAQFSAPSSAGNDAMFTASIDGRARGSKPDRLFWASSKQLDIDGRIVAAESDHIHLQL
jgi:hypothetical protein